MKRDAPELLAPAGTPDAAWAALAYGADAVYAGLPRFSARAEAGNFSPEALNELIGYAHSLGRRVYITLNTLVQQRELHAALEMLALIRDLNADGVIVQDMGVARLIRRHVPQLRLHASTQLAAHSLEGARQIAQAGFSRVVLARELSLEEIKSISRDCGIETEVFIHGALCYSYSGLCLFSSHLLGRSGNRGRCAYCCRPPFTADGQETLPFSMQHLSAAAQLPELCASGVVSLKIEGRMKSALYVAAVTDLYRRKIDGTVTAAQQTDLLADIQTVFGRPSTDLYLSHSDASPVDPVNDGHRGARIGTVRAVEGAWLLLHSSRALQKHDGLKVEMIGETSAFGFAADEMRLSSDPVGKRRFELPAHAEMALKLPVNAPQLAPGAAVYCSYSQAVRQRYEFSAPRPGQFRQRRPVEVQVVQSLERVILTVSADGVHSERMLPGPFDLARQPEKAAAAIRQSFDKLGETGWRLGNLSVEGPAVFIPVSLLNEARRQVIDDLSAKWSAARPTYPPVEASFAAPVVSGLFWSVKARRFQAIESVDEFVLEVDPAHPDEIEKALAVMPDRLRLALPVIIRDEETELFRALIERFPMVQKWEAANVGGLYLLHGKEDVAADWPLYTLNTQAASQWQEMGVQQMVLSPEDDVDNLCALVAALGDRAVVPVYQHTPLMISATRPAADGRELKDRSRRMFRIESCGKQFVVVRDTPFSLAESLLRLQTAGACRFRVDLCYGGATPQEAAEVVRRLMSGIAVSGLDGNATRQLL